VCRERASRVGGQLETPLCVANDLRVRDTVLLHERVDVGIAGLRLAEVVQLDLGHVCGNAGPDDARGDRENVHLAEGYARVTERARNAVGGRVAILNRKREELPDAPTVLRSRSSISSHASPAPVCGAATSLTKPLENMLDGKRVEAVCRAEREALRLAQVVARGRAVHAHVPQACSPAGAAPPAAAGSSMPTACAPLAIDWWMLGRRRRRRGGMAAARGPGR
jgi:hypothetical protein